MPVMYAAAGNCHVYVHAEKPIRRWRGGSAPSTPSSGPASATRRRETLVRCRDRRRFPASPRPQLVSHKDGCGDERTRALAGGGCEGARSQRAPRLGTPSSSQVKVAVAVVDSVEGGGAGVEGTSTGASAEAEI